MLNQLKHIDCTWCDNYKLKGWRTNSRITLLEYQFYSIQESSTLWYASITKVHGKLWYLSIWDYNAVDTKLDKNFPCLIKAIRFLYKYLQEDPDINVIKVHKRKKFIYI